MQNTKNFLGQKIGSEIGTFSGFETEKYTNGAMDGKMNQWTDTVTNDNYPEL